MTSVEIFLGLTATLFAVWGLFMAWLARRLGRVPFAWWFIGSVLGPLSIVPFLAVGNRRGDAHLAAAAPSPVQRHWAPPGAGQRSKPRTRNPGSSTVATHRSAH